MIEPECKESQLKADEVAMSSHRPYQKVSEAPDLVDIAEGIVCKWMEIFDKEAFWDINKQYCSD